ncbi:MAG TPA: TetR family transcriptional regulator, partial [Acidimicrobiales bacterium]
MPPARHRRLRRDESQAQTRQALLDAGARLFDERGFLATSISDIADEAGYTTGALYSNFASKEDLFLAICEGDCEAVIAELRDLLAAAPTAADRLEVVRAWHLGFVDKRRERTRAIAEFSILVHRNEASRARLRALAVRVHGAVTSLFEQQQDELGIRFRLPPPVLATAVLAM